MPSRRRRQDNQVSSDEAKQEREQVDDDARGPESEEEGEDLLDGQEKDDQPIEELDHYEPESIDNEEHELNPEARRKAERELEKRDRFKDLGGEIDDYMEEQDEDEELAARRRNVYNDDDIDEEIDERPFNDPEEVKGKLPEWIKEESTLRYIRSKFDKFLTSYKGEGDFPIYQHKIRDMCINNRHSLEVSFQHLQIGVPTLAVWLGHHPALLIPELNLTAYKVAKRIYKNFQDIRSEVFVRFKDLPIQDTIRSLKFQEVGQLIKVNGVITSSSEIHNQLRRVTYRCRKCGAQKGPYLINDAYRIETGVCTFCQGSKQFMLDKQKTVYRNYQRITLQESNSDVAPGRVPRSKDVILLGDIVDSAKPGEQVEVTGIYTSLYSVPLNSQHGFPLFATFIEANYVAKLRKLDATDLHQEEKFIELARRSNLAKQIYDSIAPSIYGHDEVKRSLTLAMFGGVGLNRETHKVRGDINVLLLGDPGIAKSQFLKSLEKVAPKCVYTTGMGASAVGLTASVKKDVFSNEWKLEAGALVIADRGMCLIDQFDKMTESDRVSIHEAMEQQSISISKAGIVTSLSARCSVIAAANPIQGRYNSQLSFADNINLSDPILSRFDVMHILKDEVIRDHDDELSTFVINMHMKSHPQVVKDKIEPLLLPQRQNRDAPIDQDFLRHYIRYARDKCHPKLTNEHNDTIVNFYSKLRDGSDRYGGMKVGVRHLESMIRLAIAHAKLHLRTEASREDVSVAINIMLKSFISTQKHSIGKSIARQFAAFCI